MKTAMKMITQEDVREFLISHFSEGLKAKGLDPDEIQDDFDFLRQAVIDSFGVLEMISAIEEKFGIQIDFENLDPAHLTTIAPLCRYVEEVIKRKKATDEA